MKTLKRSYDLVAHVLAQWILVAAPASLRRRDLQAQLAVEHDAARCVRQASRTLEEGFAAAEVSVGDLGRRESLPRAFDVA